MSSASHKSDDLVNPEGHRIVPDISNPLPLGGPPGRLPAGHLVAIKQSLIRQPNWDASNFPFKEDYTIVFKPRAVIYKDRNDNRKMIRINETILRVLRIILVILPEHPSETKVFHNEDGNPARANIKQALGSYERSHKGVKASANSDIVYFFTSAQDGDPLQDDVRLCLADDLKKAQDHNQRQVNDESKDHYPKCTRYQMKNQMSTS
ncbi:hypothetical protein Tco_0915145 [Tanacetum coccineum]